ncbi:MAG: universal stress protein [Gammaproteobacteria bacterium]
MKRFKNILSVAEHGEDSLPALERAVALAENNQARLTVIDVIERMSAGIGMSAGGPISADLQAAMLSAHSKTLEDLVEPFRARVEISTRVLVGVNFLEIIREVLRNGHDLVLKVAEDHDWLDRFFGSEDMHLLRKCPCPVWLIKPRAQTAYRRILAAVDVNDALPAAELAEQAALNQQIFEMAAMLAFTDVATLHIVYAWEVVSEHALRITMDSLPEERLNAYVEQARQHHAENLEIFMDKVSANLGRDVAKKLKPRIHLVKGMARKEIPQLANNIKADLIVMGTVSRSGVPGFIMGNTAETILNQIGCSVLAVKPPGFITPVTRES